MTAAVSDHQDVRICFDTNVWSLIAANRERHAIETLVRQRGWDLVVPPATILEAAATPQPGRRNALLDALTLGKREYLVPEAVGEAAELVAEVRRLRPSWMREQPINLNEVQFWRHFWTRTLPGRARRDRAWSAQFAQVQRATGGREHQLAMQRETQINAREIGFRIDPADLWELYSEDTPLDERLGLESGDRIEFWRAELASFFWHQLSRDATFGGDPATTISDWVQPYIDLRKVRADRRDYNMLWFREVEAARIPRNWVRCIVSMVQVNYKLGRGNPTDEQQAAYLVDCEVYVTADRRFFLILEEVARVAPVALATPVFVERRSVSAAAAIDTAIGTVTTS